MKSVILLTATIDPRGVPIGRANVNQRMEDYQSAFQRWLINPKVSNLVFCESSNTDLSPLKELIAKHKRPDQRIELLSFDHRIVPPERGIGYGEMVIIEHAFQQSTMLTDASIVTKVTGRLYIQNINVLLKHMKTPNAIDIWCDFRKNLKSTISYVFCAKPLFFSEYFFKYKNDVDDRKPRSNFEHTLAKAVHLALSKGMRWGPLPISPKVLGYSASHNEAYSNQWWKWFMKNTYRLAKRKLMEI